MSYDPSYSTSNVATLRSSTSGASGRTTCEVIDVEDEIPDLIDVSEEEAGVNRNNQNDNLPDLIPIHPHYQQAYQPPSQPLLRVFTAQLPTPPMFVHTSAHHHNHHHHHHQLRPFLQTPHNVNPAHTHVHTNSVHNVHTYVPQANGHAHFVFSHSHTHTHNHGHIHAHHHVHHHTQQHHHQHQHHHHHHQHQHQHVHHDPPKQGLTTAQIDRLPTSLLSEREAKRAGRCSICLCDFEEHDQARRLPCFHLFHSACIDEWLLSNVVCPLDKIAVSVDQV